MTSRPPPVLSDPALSEKILHSIGALIVVLDHDATIVRFNEASEAATGWTRDEVIGHRFFELLVPPEERDAVQRVFARLLAGDAPNRYENDWVRKDGSRVTIAWSNTCTFDDAGAVEFVVGTGTDLSQQRAAEAAFSALVEYTPNVAIQIYDRDGTIVAWNPASTKLYGWTASETVGRSGGATFLAGAAFDEFLAAIASIEQDGRAIGPAVFPTRHRDGREVLALSTVFRIPGATGARFVCMDVDVTSTVRMQNALRVAAGSATSDGLFLALTTQLAAAIGWRYGLAAVIEPDGVTARARALVVDGVDGGPLSYSLHGTPCSGVLTSGVCQFPRGVAELYPEDALLAQMGIEAYIGSPLRGSDGCTLGVLVLMHDRPAEATEEQRSLMELFAARLGAELERERAEHTVRSLNAELELRVAARTAELAAANAELQAFSYSVSHDLRAPVRAIAGFAAALSEDHGALLPPEGRQMLARIHAAGVRMGHLIDDLLGLSRISRQPMQIAPVDVSALCAEVGRELAATTPGRAVTLTIAPGLVVHGDPGLVQIVITNLLSNAWKFTSKREAARVDVYAEVRAGESWICVRDNGAGFDERYVGRLFGAFQRLHAVTEFEGTGIGLATVARAVHRHGGKVAAHGRIGEGATLAFHLPGTSAPRTDAPASSSAARVATRQDRRARRRGAGRRGRGSRSARRRPAAARAPRSP